MNLDAETWELLNAYHDGELDWREAAALRRRIDTEPGLRAALDEIGELSSALQPLRPAAPVAQLTGSSARRFRVGFALAAAAAVAILAGFVMFGAPDPARNPLDWHRSFASQTYPFRPSDTVTPVSQWIGNNLDLSAANMNLVDVVTLEGGDTYLHYTGANRCRLTVGAFASPPELPATSDKVLVQVWSVGPIYYAALAEGMDHAKFTAISHLLESLTEHAQDSGEARVAVRAATKSALPCA